MMGKGKTSAMINHINKSDSGTRFLYITPYLKEVERVIQACPSKKFKQPLVFGTKKRGIKHLFEKGENIATTHAMFGHFDQEIIDMAYTQNYTLVMDEVADVVEPLPISKHDLETILEKYTELTESSLLKWTATEYDGAFDDYKRLCDLGCIGIYNSKAILWLFPVSVFRGFKEIYLLTYLFSGQIQRCYFDYYGVKYKNLYIKGTSVDTYTLSEEQIEYTYPKLDSLIHIVDNEKLNRIGDIDESLSASWYKRNKENILMDTLKSNTSNFFKNYAKTRANLNIWTTYKEYESILKGGGYAKGFLSLNIRASNDYKDKIAVAYLVNRYLNPYVKNFFVANNIEVDEGTYALSEMIQFIWRSAIREGKEIHLYCPSSRMRGLLQTWIKEVCDKQQ